MNTENLLYTAVELLPESRNKLESFTKIINNPNWKIYCHHMTIHFGKIIPKNIESYIDENIGKEVKLIANYLGYDNKAMAVKVETDVPSSNAIKHITIAALNKPVDSNFIQTWQEIAHIELKGIIKTYYK